MIYVVVFLFNLGMYAQGTIDMNQEQILTESNVGISVEFDSNDSGDANTFTDKTETYKYPKMDFDLKFYLPSILGMVTGENPYLQLRKDYENVKNGINVFVESRGDIVSFDKNLSVAWSFGFGSYFEANNDVNYTSINLTLGAGIYFHPYVKEQTFTSQHGFALFLHPMYQVPVYKDSPESFVKWKSAWDIGFNLVVFDFVTVYPYMRNILAWTNDGFKPYLDFGFAIGTFFPDNNYRKAHK